MTTPFPGKGPWALWTKFSSYFWERVVDQSSSPHNPLLEVWYVSGRLELNADRVNYSFGTLHKVFEEALAQLQVDEQESGPILVLGLGAGSIPNILRNRGCLAPILGVEIDPEVVRLGKKWFGLDRIPDLEIRMEDAFSWIQRPSGPYSMIVVDLFLEDLVPKSAENPPFLLALAALLKPKGRLLFNRLGFRPKLRAESEAFFQVMQECLPGSRCIQTQKNMVLVYEKP